MYFIAFTYGDWFGNPSIYSMSNVLTLNSIEQDLSLEFISPPPVEDFIDPSKIYANTDLNNPIVEIRINAQQDSAISITNNFSGTGQNLAKDTFDRSKWLASPIIYSNTGTYGYELPIFNSSDAYVANNVINSIMAIAMAIDMGVSFIKIQKALVTLKSINARLEKFVTSKGAVVINNGYNSNINSARSSLGVLNLFGDRTKVVITPGLIETSDDFAYNRMLGEMLGGIADEIIIVKEKNKDAILMGLSSVCFDMTKVYFVNSFFDAKGVIDMASDKYVFLIENDLPNYYK